jgi:hypothetical protein
MKRTPTIPTIVGLSKIFMKKMVSPSAVGVAVATTRVDPGAIAATTTGMRVAAVMVCLVQIPSRCLHRRMIIGKRTKGAIKSREASPLASWVESKLLCQMSLQAAAARDRGGIAQCWQPLDEVVNQQDRLRRRGSSDLH